MQKTLKQKWIDILPVFASIFCAIGIVILFFWSIIKLAEWANQPSKPDTRTIEEVKTERYKQCLNYSSASRVETCKNYLD